MGWLIEKDPEIVDIFVHNSVKSVGFYLIIIVNSSFPAPLSNAACKRLGNAIEEPLVSRQQVVHMHIQVAIQVGH